MNLLKVFAVLMLLTPAPASAQWAPVAGVPATRLFTMLAAGDTLLAAADTTVYVSTNGGALWHPSARPVPGVKVIEALVLAQGHLYAATFGQGVFVSDNLGATWQPFNTGLTGGFLDSQLDVTDLVLRGTDLVAATAGAGIYLRDLAAAGAWHPYGAIFEPEQAANVNSVALGGSHLLASAGGNGMVFGRDPADAEWAESDLDNIGIHAGLQAQTALWNGSAWVVGTNLGLFLSAQGAEPWTRIDLGLGPTHWTTFATQDRRIFAAFTLTNVAIIAQSGDDGATWQDPEGFANVFIARLAVNGGFLYAARSDGLWRRSVATLAVAPDAPPAALRLAPAGAQPCGDEAHLRLELAHAGRIAIELFDLQGRAAIARIDRDYAAGVHAVTLETRSLRAGIYLARASSGAEHATARIVRIR